MKLIGIFGGICGAAFLAAGNVRADTLVDYPFTGSSLANTATELHVTGSAITLGAGLTDTTRFATLNGNPAPALRVNTDETASSYPASIAAGDDFVFTLNPDAGYALSLDTLNFDLAVSLATVTSNILVQLSGNGTTYTSVGQVTSFSTTTFTPESIDLSVANTALASGATVYVRFVVYDSSNSALTYTAFDNIIVNGTLVPAVPEPGANVLLALGMSGAAAGGWLWRRRAAI